MFEMRRLQSIAIIVVTCALAFIGCQSEERIEASLSVAEAMAGDTTGYERAVEPRSFRFPEDNGPHPDYKLEWWYLTGNLETEAGRRFGYQFTIFRNALRPPDSAASEPRASDWSSDQLYMAHFALTDVAGEQFFAFERFSREAAGLAGAQADPFRVWLEGWSVAGDSAGRAFPATLTAAQDDVALMLHLRQAKPVVLQGDRGLSQKGPGRGNASYYYSITRLHARGTVTVGEQSFAVQGTSWLDREWSTSALGDDQVGWDWFSLQLSNGYDLMYYRIRAAEGTSSRFTEGVLVGPDGATTRLSPDDVTLEPLDHWTSPLGGRYPVAWRLRVPDRGIDLRVTSFLRDQELDVSVRYWEGAVRVDGSFGGRDVYGVGYLEMTGYGDQPARRF